MIKIYNNIIPFKGYKALVMWPLLLVRKGARFGEVDERHEKIHGEQQKEMLPIGMALALALFLTGCGWWSLLALPLFIWWYVTEWLVRIMLMGFTGEWWNTHKAYRNISLEQEAYQYQEDIYYLSRRKHYAWVRYIFKNKYNN